MPLQFQSRCSRDFFRKSGSDHSDIRMSTFSSHPLILDLSTYLLCRGEKKLTLEAYAANHWFDHFLEMDAAAKTANISQEEAFRVISNLVTVLTNYGQVTRKFELYADDVYSEFCNAEGTSLPEMINQWIERATALSIREKLLEQCETNASELSIEDYSGVLGSGSFIPMQVVDLQESASRTLQWLDDMSAQTKPGIMFELALGHIKTWSSRITPAAAANSYRFALDAFELVNTLVQFLLLEVNY